MTDLIKDLHRRFDHTALRADVDQKAIEKLCEEARKYEFFAVCVNPVWVKTAAELLRGSSTEVVSTVAFPLGANCVELKFVEATKAVVDGASELDMVANIAWIKSNEMKKVETDIKGVRNAIPTNIVLKVIIEANLLSPEQQIAATKAVINGGAQFVKTGTGFAGDVTVEQVQSISSATNGKISVKAAGGIRNLEQCRRLLVAGAAKLGSSSCVSIMEELKSLNTA